MFGDRFGSVWDGLGVVCRSHGFVEVVRHLPRLYRTLWRMRDALEEERPDVLILIDYPGFNLKLAAYAKEKGIPVIFFNSPQIWAWRKGRLKTIKRVVDKMIVLFLLKNKFISRQELM